MARKNDLKVALLLDLDNFATGLKDAKTQAKTGASAITQTLDDMASKVAARVLSVQAAMHVAKKAFEGFIHTAEELEKSGEGNEGTAAIARVKAALGALGDEVVKAIAQTDTFRVAAGALADALEVSAFAMKSWAAASDLAAASTLAVSAGFKELAVAATRSMDDSVKAAADAMARAAGIQGAKDSMFARGEKGGLELWIGGVSESARADRRLAQETYDRLAAAAEKARKARMEAADRSGGGIAFMDPEDDQDKLMADRLKASLRQAEADDRLNERRAQEREHDHQQRMERAARLVNAEGGVVDAFVNSWEGGFARLGDLFHRFSGQLKDTLGGLKESTVQALGDTFDSVAFLGPLLQRVYGQSAEGARRFQAAQLALVGALAVVKSAMSFAEASDLLVEDPGGAAAKLVAAVGYAAAATLAGVATARTLSGGGSSPASGGIASSEQFGQQRQNVTVVIQNSVGGMEFVEREVLPALNRLVKADHVLLATSSQSADGLQPGRFQS